MIRAAFALAKDALIACEFGSDNVQYGRSRVFVYVFSPLRREIWYNRKMFNVPDDSESTPTIPRSYRFARKAVVVFGASQNRVMPTEVYDRFKKRVSAVNKWKKDNLISPEVRCSACGWQIPAIFRVHARGKGQLTFLSVHHLIPYSEGGTEDDGNLLALCPICHEIADYLPRIICLPTDQTIKKCVVDHLYLIRSDPEEWTRQYNRWNLEMKKRAIGTLQGDKQEIHKPFYASPNILA